MIPSTNSGSTRRVAGKAPAKVTSTTKVTVALPFSQVRIEEPSENVVALTALVEELALCLAETAPSPKADELVRRARELTAAQH